MTFGDDDYYAKADHEAASKFISQKLFREFQNLSRRPRSTSFMASWLAVLVTGFKASPSMYPIVALDAATSPRRNEILAFRWTDHDAEKRLSASSALEVTKTARPANDNSG
jgi:hypothetical protein